MRVTHARITSLLAVFALADFVLKFAINYLEGQPVGLAFLNAFVSSITCLTVIVLLIMTTGRTHLLLFCCLYYFLKFVLFVLLGASVGATIVHGTTAVMQEGHWTSRGIKGLATEIGTSMAVSLAVLSFLLFVTHRLRPGRADHALK